MPPISPPPRGQTFARIAIATALAELEKSWVAAPEIAQRLWGPQSDPALITRAAVLSGTNLGAGGWGGELASMSTAAAEFFAMVTAKTIPGRMEALRRVPLRVRLVAVTDGILANFVGETRPAPASAITLAATTLFARKVVALTVVSKELLADSSPAAENVIRQDLIRACAAAIDTAFIDADNAGIADQMPASITNGATSVIPSGNDAASLSVDLAALVAAFEGDLDLAVLVSDPLTFAEIAMARDANGAPLFPNIGPRGGEIFGVPAISSRGSPRTSSGGQIALVDPSGVGYGEGFGSLRVSTEASVQLSSSPVLGAPVTLTSLFQEDSAGIICSREVNWAAMRPGCAAVLIGARYDQ